MMFFFDGLKSHTLPLLGLLLEAIPTLIGKRIIEQG
jgi:hypothetical protein